MKRKYLIICTFAVGAICYVLISLLRVRPESLYVSTPLVTSTGQVFIPCSINDNGKIAGLVPRSENRYDVVLWDQKTGREDVVCFSGYQFINPIRINNSCQIAGRLKDANGVYQAFLWDSLSGLQMLVSLGGLDSGVQAINSHGHAVGYSQTPTGLKRAVMWAKNSEVKDLGTLGGVGSHAGSVNDSGQVAGFSQVVSGQWHAFFWDPNTGMRDLGPTSLIWPPGDCIHINNNGLVVGRFGSPTDTMLISTWRVGQGIRHTPSLEGVDAYPISLNNTDQFLVHVRSQSLMGLVQKTEKYLWMPNRGYVCLQETSDSKRSIRFILIDMNNHGQIVGWSETTELEQSGILWNPIVADN